MTAKTALRSAPLKASALSVAPSLAQASAAPAAPLPTEAPRGARLLPPASAALPPSEPAPDRSEPPPPSAPAADAAPPAAPRPFKLTGRSYLAMALAPEAPLHTWLFELDHRMARAPGLLASRPVVLDLVGSTLEVSEVEWLVEALGRRGVRIMAVEGAIASPRLPPPISGGRRTAGPDLDAAAASGEAAGAKPGPLAGAKGASPAGASPAGAGPAGAAASSGASRATPTRVIHGAVRSGQSVENLGGDVVVMGSVASGAEVVAGGSIHVYGTLRGRAIAGVAALSADEPDGEAPEGSAAGGAMILCRKLEAELVAIGGFYALADDVPADLRGRPTQARLEGGALRFAKLD